MDDLLRFVVRTPHETVLDERIQAARVPSGTGLVGLRPRQEPFVLAVEAGLVVLRSEEGVSFAATAGGLLDADRDRAVLYTPFAVASRREADVLAALDQALTTPDTELVARRRLGELEKRIVQEIRQRRPTLRTRGPHG